MDWLAEVMMKPDDGGSCGRFSSFATRKRWPRIGFKADAGKYFSFRELLPHLQEIEQQADARAKGRCAAALAVSARHHQAV